MIRRRQASWPAWQKLGRSIGWEAARDAQLMLLEDGDTFRFALTGHFSQLTPDRKQRLMKMPHVSEIITADQFSGLRFR